MAVLSSRSPSRRWVMGVPLLILLVQSTARTSQADYQTSLTANVAPSSSNLYTYKYDLSNLPQSTINGYSFTLAVDPDADLQGIASTHGWKAVYEPGSSQIQWNVDGTPFTPGTSVDFSFSSLESQAPAAYQTFGFNGESKGYTIYGTTISPAAAVPEPAGLIHLLAGLVCLVGFRVFTAK